MSEHPWVKSLPASITVCDTEGIVLEMNEAALEVYRADGGEKLLGTNLLNCHPQRARNLLERLLANQQCNVYTIEKGGRKKLIFQTPWYKDGQYAGFVELALYIPFEMPHFIRD
jgi:PAS domain-containing protein